MITIILEHASPALKGTITKWISLVKPSVYVGEVNARIREVLVATIQKEYEDKKEVSAQIYYSDKNELGYSVIEIGSPTKVLADFQGLALVSEKNDESDLQAIASLCWAKLNPYKSLHDHMYETGMLAKTFLTESKYVALVKLFQEFIMTEMTHDEVVSTISFICALHDIGKAFPNFQKKGKDSPEWQVQRCLSLIEKQGMDAGEFTKADGFRHELASDKVMNELLKEEGTFTKAQKAICDVYKNHHLADERGSQKNLGKYYDKANPKKWREVQTVLFNQLKKEFSPKLEFELKDDKQSAFATLLLGFLYRCDWIASSIFTKTDFDSKEEYKTYVAEKCKEYLEKLDIKAIPSLKKNLTIKDIFPDLAEFELRPLQKKAEELKDEDFDCVLIEDLTGSGKTETGFYFAYQAMLRRGKQGIFFGLPTNATEETMNPRIQQAIDSIYGKDAMSVTHATGMSWITEALNCEEDEKKERMGSSRETKLMFPFSTGTVDQIIKAGLLQRFALIPLTELATKVVIIDEMHAYDGYMRGVLGTTLRWLKEYHVPVIIMSATLPNAIKKEIHEVYSDKTFRPSSSYPLISLYGINGLKEFEVEACAEREYAVKVTTTEKEDFTSHVCDSALQMIKSGGNVCIICNTVNEAINTYETLKNIVSDIELHLFHGRTTLEEKHDMTELLVSKYGKDRTNRPVKSIVVATQIVEQSIDLDFDYMITELAPIDLLIQRFGRWHRHSDEGTIREKVHSNTSIEVIAFDCLNNHIVYKNYLTVIKKTKEYLQNHSELLIPQQSREMIEYAYTLEDYTDMEKALTSEVEGKASFNSIDMPNECRTIPFKKGRLSSLVPTRDSDGDFTCEVAVVSDSEYDFLKLYTPSREKCAEIMYRKVRKIKKKIVEKIEISDQIEGYGYLDGCVIITESTYQDALKLNGVS